MRGLRRWRENWPPCKPAPRAMGLSPHPAYSHRRIVGLLAADAGDRVADRCGCRALVHFSSIARANITRATVAFTAARPRGGLLNSGRFTAHPLRKAHDTWAPAK